MPLLKETSLLVHNLKIAFEDLYEPFGLIPLLGRAAVDQKGTNLSGSSITPLGIKDYSSPAKPKSEELPKKNLSTPNIEPMETASVESFDEYRAHLSLLFPKFVLFSTLPDDRKATRLSALWKQKVSSVLLLHAKETKEALIFLTNLCHAIQTHLAPCELLNLESETIDKLASAQWILAPHSLLENEKGLKQYTLSGANVLPLLEISAYLNDPSLKKPLWQELCRALSL